MKSYISIIILLGVAVLTDAVLGQELVQSNQLRRVLYRSNLLAGGNLLQSFAYATPERNRGFGGTAHKQTVDYLYNEALKYGYDVYQQELNATYTATISLNGTVNGITNGTMNRTNLELGGFRGSPSTQGPLTGALVAAKSPGCSMMDLGNFPVNLTGRILVVPRGNCTFADKVALAFSAGASAVLLVNTENTPATSSLTPGPNLVPAAGISSSVGEQLLARLARNQTLTATLDLQYLEEARVTHNVIAQTKDGDPNNVIMIGAHTDSVPEGPGINDDGSGTIALLEIMKELSNFTVNNSIRFAWWTAEEFGLLGSTYYVDNLAPEEYSKIKLYINLDMIASPNYIYGVTDGDASEFPGGGAPGSAGIEKLLQDYYTKEVNKSYIETEIDLGSTDYTPFILAGIPFGDIYSGSKEIKTEQQVRLFGGTAGIPHDPNYHKAGDTVANCNVGAWIENTKAAAHAIALSARSLAYLNMTSTSNSMVTRRGRIPEGHIGKARSKRGIFGPGMSRASCGHSEDDI